LRSLLIDRSQLLKQESQVVFLFFPSSFFAEVRAGSFVMFLHTPSAFFQHPRTPPVFFHSLIGWWVCAFFLTLRSFARIPPSTPRPRATYFFERICIFAFCFFLAPWAIIPPSRIFSTVAFLFFLPSSHAFYSLSRR